LCVKRFATKFSQDHRPLHIVVSPENGFWW